MDEKPDQILNHIEQQRDQLGRNLDELENRVRRSTDWRTYYERNPMMTLGAALGGGVLLGAALGGTSDRSRNRRTAPKLSAKSQSTANYGSSSYGQPQTPASNFAPGLESAGGSTQQGFAAMRLKTSSWVDSPHMRQITETLDQVKGALITFGIAKAKEFLAQSIPGLEEHLGSFAQAGQRQQHDVRDAQEARSQSFGNMREQASGQTPGSGTGTGASDYRSGSRGYNNPEPTGAGDQYAGAGSVRNPGVTP